MYRERIKKLQAYLAKEKLDGFIVTAMPHIQYLCGFTGSTGILIVQQKKAFFLTDFRYQEQSKKQVKGAKTIITKKAVYSELKDLTQFNTKNTRYGFEADQIICSDLETIENAFDEAILIATTGVFELFSIIKDKKELEMIEKAVEISDIAFERILSIIKPGVRENEVAAELEYQMKMLGSEKPAFETIIASGFRSAMPHGIASNKKIALGDFVTLDFGATYKGYVSDITRTIVVGNANAKQKKIYNTVLKAQKAGVKRVRPGAETSKIDAACRNIIDKAGYKKYFGHGTGHGIGLLIHTEPRIGPTTTGKVKKGMIFTVEPGIYLPGWGGVRIEDDVLVTSTGVKVLNSAPKNLLEL